jgi:hypothetical protein
MKEINKEDTITGDTVLRCVSNESLGTRVYSQNQFGEGVPQAIDPTNAPSARCAERVSANCTALRTLSLLKYISFYVGRGPFGDQEMTVYTASPPLR